MNEKQIFLQYWQEEKEAVLVYSRLADTEKDPGKKEIYKRLAQTEEKHSRMWEEELIKRGVSPRFRPGIRSKLLLAFQRFFGNEYILNFLEKNEGTAVNNYSRQAALWASDEVLAKKLRTVAVEEKDHAKVLAEVTGQPLHPVNEAWHRGGSSIREIIFGMNDGLLSTFSLIMGVAGGATDNSVVLLSGLAGAVAGAISMAAGAFIAAKSEREVLERHIKTERAELEMMPETEREELRLLYELKGVSPEVAENFTEELMADKDAALQTMVREELGFAPEELESPLTAGLSSGISFIVGAALPIFPYLFFRGGTAFYSAIGFSLGGFYLIGAGRTVVTGKNPWRSGLEMLLIGAGAAVVTYLIGKTVGVTLLD